MTPNLAPVRAIREDGGRFAALRNQRVLVYWPHGLGDWIHFGTIAPLLEPSNAYAIVRFGDDYVSAMERNALVRPIATGSLAPSDGSEYGTRHLGLRLSECDGRTVALQAPASLSVALAKFAPSVVLWTDYPETEGRTPYPFHTKARNLARRLVPAARLTSFDLSRPLPSSIAFAPPDVTQRLVDERLRSFAPRGTRLCAISRAGVTAARKNWNGIQTTRDFVDAMSRQSPQWRFISMDDEDLGPRSAGFRALFAGLNEPFARAFKALASNLDLFVGIPAGPLHLTLARGGVPVVGLWLAHHPDWYDEPNPDAIHLIGQTVRDRRFHRRLATTTKPESLQHRLVYLDTHEIGAEPVLEAARTLTG